MTMTTGEPRSGETSSGDDRPGGGGFLDTKLAAYLLGEDTVAYLRRRQETKRRYPTEKMAGESRWEALDSDGPDPGPYAMLDEQAGALMTSAEFRDAVARLRQSYLESPIMVDLEESPVNGIPTQARGTERGRR